MTGRSLVPLPPPGGKDHEVVFKSYLHRFWYSLFANEPQKAIEASKKMRELQNLWILPSSKILLWRSEVYREIEESYGELRRKDRP